MRRLHVTAASTVLVAAPVAAVGDEPLCPFEQARLEAPDGTDAVNFGTSVALSGDTLVVGDLSNDGAANSAGAVYVFTRSGSTWSPEAYLVPADLQELDGFGGSVSVDADTLVAGAASQDDPLYGAGAAYVFVRTGTTWTSQAKLRAPVAAVAASFGASVALDGDTILVGAPGEDGTAGAVYVFVRDGTTWSRQARLVAADRSSDERFGSAVALSAETAVVGAITDRGTAVRSGSGYVFVRAGTSWSQQAKLVGQDASAGAAFGCSASVSGDTAVFGARGHNGPAGNSSGAAYVFARDGASWTQEAKLEAPDALAFDHFGSSVALRAGALVAGAPTSPLLMTPGSAYAYARSDAAWHLLFKLTPSSGPVANEYGDTVAIDGDTIAVGDVRGDAAYVYGPSCGPGTPYCPCLVGPCGNVDADAGCANSTGAGAELTATGSTDPDTVDLTASGAVPGEIGIFFQGTRTIALPFGDGLRCAGGSVLRILPPSTVAPDGTASYGPSFGDAPLSVVTGVAPGSGETRHYQFWYRDPLGPCGAAHNSSSAYSITW